MLKALRRTWYWLCQPTEWRVVKHKDGLWYVEIKHLYHGWVYISKGHEFMVDAAEEGRKLYERKV